MMGLTGKIAAVPIRMLAQLAGLVTFVDELPLWSACWRLSRRAEDSKVLLYQVCSKRGIMPARKLAEEMLAQTKDCEIAATIGFLEYAVYSDIHSVERWVREAKDKGYKNQELLLHLELILSNFLEEYDDKAIIEEILSRNDLAMETSLYALIEKAGLYLEARSWEQAEAIADRILGIQEQVDAQLVKWTVCMKNGDHAGAKIHFNKAKTLLPEDRFNIVAAKHWLILGRKEKAMQFLYAGGQDGFRIRESKSQLGRLANSDEFRKFCIEKAGR